jgi:hypothetical protein
VHQAMVTPAKLHQVVETGIAAVRPVPDVVSVDEILVIAARKTATVVPGAERAGRIPGSAPAADRWRHRCSRRVR